MPLKKGRTYTFRIKVENKSHAAIIHGKSFINMTKRTDGTFFKDFLIPKDISEIKLGIADAAISTYEVIAWYSVE